jgi:hypothetical protein
MADDIHPIIKKTAAGDGNDPDRIDPEAFRTHQSAKFVLHGPRERVQYLEQLADVIGMEGTSLKSRAELLDLYRSMDKTHRQLLSLKR